MEAIRSVDLASPALGGLGHRLDSALSGCFEPQG